MLNRIRTIVDKEWAEVFKNRLVLFTVGFLPLIFTVMPLGILYATRGAMSDGSAAGDVSDLPPAIIAACGPVTPFECFQIYLMNQMLVLFMLMPLIIPISIAAYSIVGEKTTRSLEPLLATPITTVELLTGKALAAVIPAILATWGGFLVFVLGVPLVGGGAAALRAVLNPVWLLAVFVAGPLMAVIAVNFAVIISSRTSDPRVAEQLSAVLVVPLIVMIFGQIAGFITLNLTFMLAAIAVLAVAAVALIYLGVRFFERETILTKWK
jgi:ABC-2 type transport system permease protein